MRRCTSPTPVEGPTAPQSIRPPLACRHHPQAEPAHPPPGSCHPVSRALTLAYAPLVDDYRLRCHIQCKCRDAKQSRGLEDFMHVTLTGVTHAAHLSWFMVHVAYHLQADVRPRDPDNCILD